MAVMSSSSPSSGSAGARVLAVANQKGGVAKTTTVASIGAALGELGHRVLLLDLDPQACLTFSLGIDPEDVDVSVHHVLTKGVAPAEVIVETDDGVDLMPATIELARAEADLLTRTGREYVVRSMVEELPDYDWVLLDCPPSLGVLTVAALTAASSVMIPLQCETLSHRGVGQLLDTVHDVRRFTNRSLEVLGVLPTLYDGRTRHARAVLDTISQTYSLDVIEPPIPKSIRFAEAPAAGRSILATSRSSKGADAYREGRGGPRRVRQLRRPGLSAMGKHKTKVRYDRATALLLSTGVTGFALLAGGGTFGPMSTPAGSGGDPQQVSAQARYAARPATGASTSTRKVASEKASEKASGQHSRLTGTGVNASAARASDDPDGSEVAAPVPAGSGQGHRVVFDMSDQRVWLVDDDGEVMRSYLVSGSVTDNLDPGSYKVYSRSRNAVGIDDSGTMQYFVRFTRGDNAAIGFHDIPTKDGSPLQTERQLGSPQSHGCIRQARPDAIKLWDFSPIGTPVDVVA